jgi:hypothetical protein
MMESLVHDETPLRDPRDGLARRPVHRGGWELAALAAMAAGAAAAALAARWNHGLNVDEPFTALAVQRPLGLLLDVLRHDNTPVTYVALKVWTMAAGDGERAMRVLMAASYGLAVFVTGLAGRSVAGIPGGLVAAGLVATSGSVGLLHAATVRPYALLTLASALAAYLLMTAIGRTRPISRARWVTLTAVHLLGLLTHPIYVFVALASSASVSLTLGSRGRALATTGVAAIAAYLLAWGWMVRATLQLPATAWLAEPRLLDLWNAYLGIWGNRNGFMLAGSLLALVTARGAVRRVADNEALCTAIWIAALSLAAPFFVSFVKPVFHATRTPMLVLPFVALAAGGVLAILGTRVLMAVLGLSLVVGAAQHVAAGRRGDRDPTRESLAQVLARARDGDVLVSAGLSYAPIEYYLGRRAESRVRHVAFPAEVAAHPGWIDERALSGERLRYEAEAAGVARRLAQGGGRVYVFVKTRGVGAPAGALLTGALDRVLPRETTLPLRGAFFDGVVVYGAATPPSQSSGGSPPGAIFTSRGSNRASGSTRSRCAAMTSSMSLYAIGTSSSPAESSVTSRSRSTRRAASHVNIAFARVRLMRRPAPCAAESSDAATPFPLTT